MPKIGVAVRVLCLGIALFGLVMGVGDDDGLAALDLWRKIT